MNSLSIMQQLAATNSRNEKEQIIFSAYMNKCYEFFEGARLTYDPLISFGVAKVAEIQEDDDSEGTFTWNDFKILAQKLINRELTGHAARDAIHAAASECHVLTWNKWYRRILLKDFDVGTSDTLINKVLGKIPDASDYMIPVFACMLAKSGDDDAGKKKLKGKKLIDIKIDGCRSITYIDPKTKMVESYTRTGHVIDNFPELKATMTKLLDRFPGGVALDGEFMSPKGFPHLMTLVNRKDPHPDTAIIYYALFDIVPLDDFRKGFCKTPQRQRRAVLETLQSDGMFADLDHKLRVVPQIEVDLNTEEGRKKYKEFNIQVLADKYEGIMVKDPEAPYEGKRSAAWLKVKPFIDVTLEIVGFNPGEPDTKYANTLGTLACKGFDLGVNISVNVPGFPEELRTKIWNNKEKYLGMMVDVIAGELSLEEGSEVFSLRFPRWKGFRGTKPGEKI
jgi:DNA ligase 1